MAGTAFNFSRFSPNMPEITLEGDACITEPVIDLTSDFMYLNSSNGSVGRATYSEPVHLWDKDSGLLADFITHFSFVINSSHGNSTIKGNGFAFFLSPNSSHLPPSSGGAYLGLNSSTRVQDNYVAVEFDTARSPWDPANAQAHIGIDLNSLYSVVTVPWTWNDIANGGMINALVRYNSSSKNLSVFVTNGDYRSITKVDWYSLYTEVDLRDLLPEWVTLGFTASTTIPNFEKHEIHSWNFESSLENHKITAEYLLSKSLRTTLDPNQISPQTNQSSPQSSEINQTSIPPISSDPNQISLLSSEINQSSIPPISSDPNQISLLSSEINQTSISSIFSLHNQISPQSSEINKTSYGSLNASSDPNQISPQTCSPPKCAQKSASSPSIIVISPHPNQISPETSISPKSSNPNQISPKSSEINRTSNPPTSPVTNHIDVPKGVIVSVIGIVALVLILGFLCFYCYVKKRRQREALLKSEKSSQRSPLKNNQPSRDEGLDKKSIPQSPGRENNRTPTEEAFVKQSSQRSIRCENSSVPADVEGFEENSITMSVITQGNNSIPTEEGPEVIWPQSLAEENNTFEGIEDISIAQTFAHESSNTPEDEGFEKEIISNTNSKSESNHLLSDEASAENIGTSSPLTCENNSRPAEEGSEEKCSPRSFSYQELVTANFTHLLGKGGFGSVYKGVLTDGNSESHVAVKKMAPDLEHARRRQAYEAEVKAISQFRHNHLVQLIGWCQENEEFLIVYEFMSNGNLETHLFDRNSSLNWRKRYDIALGLASALSYMHGEPNKDYVIHRDIKPNNILLDSNFNAKLGDFGLAKLVESGNSARTTQLVYGTEGYVPAEYVKSRKPSKKTDVYSFGIVALEIATGRAAVEEAEIDGKKQKIYLSNLVEMQYKNNNILDLADPQLGGNFEEHEMERLMVVGLACAHADENRRPEMGEVLKMLQGETPLPDLQSHRCSVM